MGKGKNALLIIFSIVYLIFSVILIGCFILTEHKLVSVLFYGFLVVILLGIGLWMKHKKIQIPISKRTFFIVIGISVLIRIVLLFIPYLPPIGDYATFYNNAVAYSSGTLIDTQYIAIFSHLSPYIVLLGTIFKLLGTSYIVVVLVNIVFDLLSIYLVYLILKKACDIKTARLGSMIWGLFPLHFLWDTVAAPTLIFQACFLLSIYLLLKTMENSNNKKNFFLYSIIAGITLGMANLFRPIMMIILIAVVLYYFLFGRQKQSKIWVLGVSLFLIVIPFQIIGRIHLKLHNDMTGYVTSTLPGWNVYVGSTGYIGAWTPEVGEKFHEMTTIPNFDIAKFQEILFKEGIENYRERGLHNIGFMKRKFSWLTTNLDEYSVQTFQSTTSMKSNVGAFELNISMSFGIALLFLANVVIGIKMLKEKEKFPIFLMLITIGIVSSHLLLEVSPRYLIPLYVPLILIGAYIISPFIKLGKKEV